MRSLGFGSCLRARLDGRKVWFVLGEPGGGFGFCIITRALCCKTEVSGWFACGLQPLGPYFSRPQVFRSQNPAKSLPLGGWADDKRLASGASLGARRIDGIHTHAHTHIRVSLVTTSRWASPPRQRKPPTIDVKTSQRTANRIPPEARASQQPASRQPLPSHLTWPCVVFSNTGKIRP